MLNPEVYQEQPRERPVPSRENICRGNLFQSHLPEVKRPLVRERLLPMPEENLWEEALNKLAESGREIKTTVNSKTGQKILTKEDKNLAEEIFEAVAGKEIILPVEISFLRKQAKDFLEISQTAEQKLLARSLLGKIDYQTRKVLASAKNSNQADGSRKVFESTIGFRLSCLDWEAFLPELNTALTKEAAFAEQRLKTKGLGKFLSLPQEVSGNIFKKIIPLALPALLLFAGLFSFKSLKDREFAFSFLRNTPAMQVAPANIETPPPICFQNSFPPLPENSFKEEPIAIPEIAIGSLPVTGEEKVREEFLTEIPSVQKGDKIVLEGETFKGNSFLLTAIDPPESGYFGRNKIVWSGYNLANPGPSMGSIHSGGYKEEDGQVKKLPGQFLLDDELPKIDLVTEKGRVKMNYVLTINLPKDVFKSDVKIIMDKIYEKYPFLPKQKYFLLSVCYNYDSSTERYQEIKVFLFTPVREKVLYENR
ncbi:MAG: hypothetical protein M1514_00375 [Patescibacteria group bacterium]|nr:hypothetical protein [Patescibacteria group bacterium]